MSNIIQRCWGLLVGLVFIVPMTYSADRLKQEAIARAVALASIAPAGTVAPVRLAAASDDDGGDDKGVSSFAGLSEADLKPYACPVAVSVLPPELMVHLPAVPITAAPAGAVSAIVPAGIKRTLSGATVGPAAAAESVDLPAAKKRRKDGGPIPCPWPGCPRTVSCKSHLVKHMRTHTNERPFPCTWSDCSKSFKWRGDLTQHIKWHKGERSFMCTYPDCNKVFPKKSTLKDHERIHTGEKPFVCEECGHAFVQKSNLRTHVKRHVEQVNALKKMVGPFVCRATGCESVFTNSKDLIDHVQKNHIGAARVSKA